MRKAFVIFAVSILLLLISGCYTILQHPAAEENYDADDYRADCLGCHTDYHEYPYGYFYGNYPNFWWSTPRWGHYYAYPWWWDNYWYDGSRINSDINDDDEYSPRSSSGEKVVRRDALRPPYTMGVTPITRSGGASDAGSEGGNVSPKASGSDNQKKQEDEKAQDKNEKKEAEDNKKATRRGGGR